MEKQDFSFEIFNKFYSEKSKVLKITLKDKTVLTGKFIGFFPGEKDTEDPYVIKWHFLNEKEIEKYEAIPLQQVENSRVGLIIKQEEIESVTFK